MFNPPSPRTTSNPARPNRWLRRLVRLALPSGDRNVLIHDLDDLFARRAARGGRLGASFWYLRQPFSFTTRLTAEGSRTMGNHTLEWMRHLGRESRHAARRLFRAPAYLVVTALTLGIGVGGVITVYGVADWVLLREVPGVSEPNRLAWLRLEDNETPGAFAWGHSDVDRREIARLMPSLDAVSGSREWDVHLRLGDGMGAQRVPVELASANYFSVLAMAPHRGRFFNVADYEGSHGPAEVVISHDLWRSRWDTKENAIGSQVWVNGDAFTVIGVAPPGFRGAELPGHARAWLPPSAIVTLVRVSGREYFADAGASIWSRTVGRMKPGATIAQVQQEATSALQIIRDEGRRHSFRSLRQSFTVYHGIGLSPWVRPEVNRTLRILATATALLLLLAVCNVATLSLARAAANRTDIAVRRALGAARHHVLQIPLLEGALVGVVAGASAWGIATLAIRTFEHSSLSSLGASLEGVRLAPSLLVSCVGLAMVAGLLAGAFPGWWNTTRTVDSVLKAKGSGKVEATRLRNLFVVAQVALSLVLTIAGGLAVRTVTNLQNVDLGVQSSGRLTWSLDPTDNGYSGDSISTLIAELERALVADPRVASVGFVSPAPFSATGRVNRFRPSNVADEDADRTMYVFWVSPSFFATLELPILYGRGFRQNDPMDGIVFTTGGIKQLFGDVSPADAIGRSVRWGSESGQSAPVIGITQDVRLVDVQLSPYPVVFRPWTNDMRTSGLTAYATGTPGSRPSAIAALARETIARLDPELPMFDVQLGEDLVATRFAEQRVVARLASILAAIGLFLCALGLFGVLSYAVTARRREFGIKIALGADARHITRKVVWDGLRLTLIGVAVGLPAAWVLAHLATAHLYGVTSSDPMTYAAGAMALTLVSLVAGVSPVRRATRVSPVEVLREE